MTAGLRQPLALGFLLASGFTGLGQSAAAASPETRSTVTVHVYNLAQVDHKTLGEAEEVATEIFLKAGVESRWVEPSSAPQKGQGNAVGEGSRGGSNIQLSILSRGMTDRLRLPNGVMGVAPGTERDRQLVYVFYNRVEGLGRAQERTRVEGNICASASTAQILGHAIAHEIGHLLLNLKSHSDTGIMQGDWNLKQLQDACYGSLLFTPRQAETLRAEVGRRNSQEGTLEAN